MSSIVDNADSNIGVKPLVSRRQALNTIGISAVAGAALLGLPGLKGFGLTKAAADSSQALTDVDILQFALNLEYLEAEFYTYAITGSGIATAGIGTSGSGGSGPTTGGKKVALSPIVEDIVKQIMYDEQTHVTFLRTALSNAGIEPVAKATIDLTPGTIRMDTESEFLATARAFESVGVSAYIGGADTLAGSPYLTPAAQILGIEAQHESMLRLLIAELGIQTTPVDNKDVVPPPSGRDYFNQHLALSLVRDPAEVLNILYGGAQLASGGFFPKGVNGTIHTS